MYNIMRNSTTAMIANQEKINITSNNIVNSQTVGYKKLDIGFIDLYTKSLDTSSNPNNSNGAITGTGVRVGEAVRNLSQGALKNTSISTNLAIDGQGYFKVSRPDGSDAYTRNGEFVLDGNGRLVDDNGNILEIIYDNQTLNQNMDLSSDKLSINKDGEVFIDSNKIGNINLYMPQGTSDLVSIGDNLFVLKDEASMDIAQDSSIYQGYVEISNVNLQNEMTDLIRVQRAFQFNSKGLQAVDEMWSMINNLQSR